MKIFYQNKCIKPVSCEDLMETSANNILVAQYKFDCSLCNLFPNFNPGFEYFYVDEQEQSVDVMTYDIETISLMTYDAEPDENGNLMTEIEIETPVLRNAGDIITRSIYSNKLPTEIIFGCYDATTNREKSLLEVCYCNMSKVINAHCMFRGCFNLTKINTNNWNINRINTTAHMFSECRSLEELDLSKFNTSHSMYMNYMFNGCNKLTRLNLSNFNTSKVTDMQYMFYNCFKITSLDLGTFDIDNVIVANEMFTNCSGLYYIKVPNASVTNKIAAYLPIKDLSDGAFINILKENDWMNLSSETKSILSTKKWQYNPNSAQ